MTRHLWVCMGHVIEKWKKNRIYSTGLLLYNDQSLTKIFTLIFKQLVLTYYLQCCTVTKSKLKSNYCCTIMMKNSRTMYILSLIVIASAIYYFQGETKHQTEVPANSVRTQFTVVRPHVIEMDLRWKFRPFWRYDDWSWSDALTWLYDAAASFITSMRGFGKSDVLIKDARSLMKSQELAYSKSGFTLLPFISDVKNWDDVQGMKKDSEDFKRYIDELKDIVIRLHPNATKIKFGDFLTRGEKGEKPKTSGHPHLDFYDYLGDLPAPIENNTYSSTEFVRTAPDAASADLILGIWKPLQMANPIYDSPLAMMHADDFDPKQIMPASAIFESKNKNNRWGSNTLGFLREGSKNDRWYYFSNQTCDEAIVFTQWRRPATSSSQEDGAKNKNPNVHTGFNTGPLPEGADTRFSIEARAFVYF